MEVTGLVTWVGRGGFLGVSSQKEFQNGRDLEPTMNYLSIPRGRVLPNVPGAAVPNRPRFLSNCDEELILEISNPVENHAFMKYSRNELLEK